MKGRRQTVSIDRSLYPATPTVEGRLRAALAPRTRVELVDPDQAQAQARHRSPPLVRLAR